jgi:hypothetical protein
VIWAILAAVGVPLWLCAVGILALVMRNRSLRRRYGNMPVRLRTAPDSRWVRGHAIWVHDVFAFRGSPAAWKETLFWVHEAQVRDATVKECKKLHGLGGNPVIAMLDSDGSDTVEVAARGGQAHVLLGPFSTGAPDPGVGRAGERA